MKQLKFFLGSMALLFCVCVIAGNASAQEKKVLRLVFKKGAVHRTKITMDQNITQTIQDKRFDIVQTIGMGYAMEVKDLDPQGLARIKVTYETILFKQKNPAGVIEYDSTRPPAQIHSLAKSYALLLGESFDIYMDPTGSVSRLDGIDAMFARMLSKLDIAPGPQKEEIEKNLKKNINDEVMKEAMEKMMAIYPEQPVGIGDSWSKTTTVAKIFPMITVNTWTVTDRKNGTVFVEVSSQVRPNPEAQPTKMGAIDLQYSLGGEQKGTLEFDENSGWLNRGKLSQRLSGEIIATGGPNAPDGISWPISMDSIVSIEKF